jgi:hypothetical protein
MRALKDCRGVAAIEFAIVFPVFIFIIFFLMEICLIGFTAITIENSVSETTRLGKIGDTVAGLSREQFIRQQIRDRSYGLVNPGRLAITSTVVANAALPNVNSVVADDYCVDGTGNPAGFCPCPGVFFDNNANGLCDAPGPGPSMNVGGPGDVVRYLVTYRWRVLTPILPLSTYIAGTGFALGDANGDVLIVSGGAVRNE